MNHAMTHPEKPTTRTPVDLPENRHRWASNDEVKKPTVILRGPNYLIDVPAPDRATPKKSSLPTIAAYGIAGITLAIILIAIYLR